MQAYAIIHYTFHPLPHCTLHLVDPSVCRAVRARYMAITRLVGQIEQILILNRDTRREARMVADPEDSCRAHKDLAKQISS